MKRYKLLNMIIWKNDYGRDVIFREFGGTSRFVDVTREKDPEKLEFELKNEEHDSGESTKLDEEV